MQRKYQRIRIEQLSHVQYPQLLDIIECDDSDREEQDPVGSHHVRHNLLVVWL